MLNYQRVLPQVNTPYAILWDYNWYKRVWYLNRKMTSLSNQWHQHVYQALHIAIAAS
jgi:hypothetical protein